MSGCIVYLYQENGKKFKVAEFDEIEDARACLGGDETATEDGIYNIEQPDAK